MNRLCRNSEYADFRLRLAEKLEGHPHVCQIELTFDCNFGCLYCCLGSWRNNGVQMSFPLAKRIIDQLVQEGFLYLTLTGGEPLMAHDFFQIYSYARAKGFLIVVLTNASLIDEPAALFFSRCRPFYLELPLHSLDDDLFGAISGSPGSLAGVLRGIELLKKYSVPFRLKTKLITLNSGELDKVANFARALDVPYSVSTLLHSCFDHDKTPLRYRVDHKQCVDGDVGAWKNDSCLGRSTETKQSERRGFSCGALRFSMDIDPDGKLLACSNLRSPSYDLRSGSLHEGIRALRADLLQGGESQCDSCSFAYRCEWCPGIAFLETGNPSRTVRYLCEEARRGGQ